MYHCMSRTVNGEVKWDDCAKEVLRKQLWQVADFCGLQVLTYSIMSNHFHVLVSVPDKGKADAALTDSELLRRYKVLYPEPTLHQQARVEVLEAKLKAGGEEAEALRASLVSRMHDLPEFMRTLKQRFSVWYNQQHERFGTLWAERYKSVLVQGEGNPLLIMALYIDLNAVRAGMVTDPKAYRFCGYGEAESGEAKARRGLAKIVASFMGNCAHVEDAVRQYRERLFARGSSSGERRIAREQAARVLNKRGGDLPLDDMLRCTMRCLTDGTVFGTLDFVEEHMHLEGKRPVPLLKDALKGLHIQHRLRKPAFQ